MTPIVLSVDVEPDPRVVDRAAPNDWIGFERFVDEVPTLRARLADATGRDVRFTWYLRMDEQIAATWGTRRWVADRYGAQLAALEADGDELGLHLHTWRWLGSVGTWIAEREDQAWIAASVHAALDAFEDAFGRPCRSHRGGDRFISPTAVEILAARGVTTDLTVEPGWPSEASLAPGELARGITPSYQAGPYEPYRARSPERFLEPGDGMPVMIPLFSTPAGPVRAPLSLWTAPEAFAAAFVDALATWDPPVIAFAVRSDLPLQPEWPSFVTNVDLLARVGAAREARFTTAGGAAAVAGSAGGSP
jgi:hypothetical protein